MSEPIVDDLVMLEQGVHMYDSYLDTMVFVILPVVCLLCDNVRASELLNHRGSRADKLCRMCMVSKHAAYIHVHYFNTVEPF